MKNMTLAFGKPICVGLYTAFAFLAISGYVSSMNSLSFLASCL